jgi:small-conductance mechanosensitive channel
VIDRLAEALNLTPVQSQLLLSGVWLLSLTLIRWIVLAIVHRRIDDPAIWYRTQKLLSYTITFIGLVVLASIWIEGSGVLSYIGLLTAGLAIALSDVLKNLAGWLFIVLRRPFRLGERIQIGEHKGDVIDIKAFRFTLFEVGTERVAAEQPTGRLLHVPNGLVFTEPLANFTEGFQYVWHEIPVLITFESNWQAAESIILDTIRGLSPNEGEMRAMGELRAAMIEYRIGDMSLDPQVFLTVRDSGVLLTGRLLAEVHGLRVVEQQAWKGLLTAFAARDDIELAYPTIRTYFGGPVRIDKPE